MKLWICGKYIAKKDEGTIWDFQGVFFTKKRAIKACINKSYFIAPAILGKEIPSEQINWPGTEYPI